MNLVVAFVSDSAGHVLSAFSTADHGDTWRGVPFPTRVSAPEAVSFVDAQHWWILGSGSTAFAAALRAQELGKTAVMTEERTVGGTCVNRGCLPSKNLIEAAKLVHDARNPRYPGLRGADLGLDFARLIAQKDEIVESYRGKKYESLVGGKIGVERGHARFVDAHTVEVNGKRLHGETVPLDGAPDERRPGPPPARRWYPVSG